uniref:Uncharacterized protein n=1 Tax=Yersinia similis TaxID=367190 RepID=S0F2E0_9GAMM|nr:hypothetical protein [Yersinia similis]
MTISRRHAMKLLLPATFISLFFGSREYIENNKESRIISNGDLNDYIESGQWMVSGKVFNSPSESGYLNVISLGGNKKYILQQYFYFDNPSIVFTRKKTRIGLPGPLF